MFMRRALLLSLLAHGGTRNPTGTWCVCIGAFMHCVAVCVFSTSVNHVNTFMKICQPLARESAERFLRSVGIP